MYKVSFIWLQIMTYLMTRKQMTTVSIEETTHEALKRLAKKERRTIKCVLECAIKTYAQHRDALTPRADLIASRAPFAATGPES